MSTHLGSGLTGTSTFRMMPTDAFDEGPSSAVISRLGDEGLSVAYTWVHPADGEQSGGLVIGAVAEDGTVEASWFDTWHQKPGLMQFTGARTGERVELSGTYLEEWGWTITIDTGGDGVTMTMCNVIPESALGMAPPDGPPISAGPYDVMVAQWR